MEGPVGNIVVAAGNVAKHLDCSSGPLDNMAEPASYFTG